MKKIVQRVRRRFLFAVRTGSVGVKRQQGNGFGQDSDASVDRRGLERRFLTDCFAAGAGTEEKAVGTAPETVLGACPRREKSRNERDFHESPPEVDNKISFCDAYKQFLLFP